MKWTNIYLSAAICIGATSFRAEAAEVGDSVQTTSLPELTVKGDNAVLSKNKSTYYPTDQQKKASINGMQLIGNMPIPELQYNPASNAITTANGSEVKYFINGQEASEFEVKMLMTKYATSVEFLEHPTDPKFKNAAYAVNFIVREPEYGGYTRINETLMQDSPISNSLGIYSKFKYKRMTYDLMAAGDMTNSDYARTWYNDLYNLEDTDGNDYTLTMDYVPIEAKYRNNRIPVIFRALYSTDKTSISNAVGFTFNGTRNTPITQNVFINSPYEDTETLYEYRNPRYSRSITWNGSYLFYLPRNISINLDPKFGYTNQSIYTTNLYRDLPDLNVFKNTYADSYEGSLNFTLRKAFNQRHSINALLGGRGYYARTRYEGSSNFTQRYRQTNVEVAVDYNFNSEKFYLQFAPYLNYTVIVTEGVDLRKLLPGFSTNMSWSPTSRHKLGLYASYVSEMPPLASWTEGIVKNSSYIYTTGNTQMKNYRKLSLSFNYTWIVHDRFNATAYLSYSNLFDKPIFIYEKLPKQNALLGKYYNDGDFHNLLAGLNLNANFFNHRLGLSVSPKLRYYKSTGIYNERAVYFQLDTYAVYFLKNFSFSAYWQTPSKQVSSYCFEKNRNIYQYGLAVGYNVKNWAFELLAKNFFRNSYVGYYASITTPNYRHKVSSENNNAHRNFSLTISYTFEYGKKINDHSQIQSLQNAASVIL
ncbi:MAG: outer membrane beta-barrel family protein [Muribaculum sp.]|nr:outer membrane beta-barrel family protein [Muribaculum sp.]